MLAVIAVTALLLTVNVNVGTFNVVSEVFAVAVGEDLNTNELEDLLTKLYAILLYTIIAVHQSLIYVNAAVALVVSEVLLSVNALVLTVGIVGVQVHSIYHL